MVQCSIKYAYDYLFIYVYIDVNLCVCVRIIINKMSSTCVKTQSINQIIGENSLGKHRQAEQKSTNIDLDRLMDENFVKYVNDVMV